MIAKGKRTGAGGGASGGGTGGGPGRLRRWLEGTAGIGRFRTFRVRLIVQTGFTLTCLLIGVQFARFIGAAQEGTLPLPVRPPGAEGFLPISGLMGFLDWIYQGTLNVIHPAATVLFLLFVATALLLRKAFCSWICPVGLLSESLARLGQKIFGRNFRIPIWLDIPLRGLKYILLGFFVLAIIKMGPLGLRAFIESPYNRVSDVKMFLFFARVGSTAVAVLLLLALLSVFTQGAWCRYLCPYGALLGLFSWLSPVKITRDTATCTGCNMCDKVCMARLPVASKKRITSVECTGCLDCVSVCPVSATLTVGTRRRSLSALTFALALLLLFFAGYGGARVAGIWRSGIGDAEYAERIRAIDHPMYGHPGADGR